MADADIITPPDSSSGSETAASPPRWASACDWEAYRGTITHLYEERGMSLDRVVQTMRDKHGFLATKKMYKARFKKWNVNKNLRYELVSKLLEQKQTQEAIAMGDLAPVVLFEGRQVDSRRLKEYVRRTKRPGLRVRAAAPTPPTPSPSPVALVLAAPAAVGVPEECMHLLRDHVRASVDPRLWQSEGALRNAEYTRQLLFWNQMLNQTHGMLQRGDTTQAFQTFGQVLDQYKRFLQDGNSRLFIYTYLAICRLLVDRPEMARSLIAHIHELCKIVNGDAHPLSRVMGRIRRMESSDIQQYARHLITFYMDCMVALCADSPFFAMENLQLRTRLLSVQADEGFLERQVAVSECQRVVEAIEKQPIRWKDVLVGVVDTISFVAQTLPPGERSFASALRVVPHLRQWYLFLSFKAAVQEKDVAGVMPLFDQLLELPVHDADMRGRQAWVLAHLEITMRNAGDREATERAASKYRAVVDRLQEEAQALPLRGPRGAVS